MSIDKIWLQLKTTPMDSSLFKFNLFNSMAEKSSY